MHLVDAHQAAADFELLLQQRTHDSGNVGVDHQQQRPAVPHCRHGFDNPLTQRAQRVVVGAVAPLHGQREPAVTIVAQIQPDQRLPHGSGDVSGRRFVNAADGGHRHVAQRQVVWMGEVDRVAAQLHNILRGPDAGGADRFARL